MSIRVLLADDHTVVRQCLKAVLEQEGFEVVGEACNGNEAIEMAARLQPEIAVLDVSMPQLNGIDAAREITKISPITKVILLSMFAEDELVLQGLRAGSVGYLVKSNSTSELAQAIRTALKGERYLGSTITPSLLKQSRTPGPSPQLLSPRERQVLQLVAEGNTTKEIGALLNVSTKTADTHRTNIMSKLNIHETATLVRYAVRQGLVK